MVLASPSEPLSQLEVLVVDCQATAAAPRGHLLEIGWARVLGTTITHADASETGLQRVRNLPNAAGALGLAEKLALTFPDTGVGRAAHQLASRLRRRVAQTG